jgi:hypothetical protein
MINCSNIAIFCLTRDSIDRRINTSISPRPIENSGHRILLDNKVMIERGVILIADDPNSFFEIGSITMHRISEG